MEWKANVYLHRTIPKEPVPLESSVNTEKRLLTFYKDDIYIFILGSSLLPRLLIEMIL